MHVLSRMRLCLLTLGLLLAACVPNPASAPLVSPETPVPEKISAPVTTSIPDSVMLSGLSTQTPLELAQVPVYYDATYAAVINNSKLEEELVIYASLTEKNWETVLQYFKIHYPWVKVTTYNLGAAEVFQRYFNEVAENKRTADLVISSDPVGWHEFSVFNILFYTSQEGVQLPDWAKSAYGTYVVAGEPLVLVYNQELVPNPPQSLTELAGLITDNPGAYRNQIVTYDVRSSALGLAANWFWTKEKQQTAWDFLNLIGKTQPRLLNSSDEMLDLLASGEAKIGYFLPLSAVLARQETNPNLGWSYLSDGQPVILTSLAVTQKNTSLSSARLMVDFLLSQEGQYALAESGLTIYRADLAGITERHFDQLTAALGDANIILGGLDGSLNGPTVQLFVSQWQTALGQ